MAPLPPLGKHMDPARLNRCEARHLLQVHLDRPLLLLLLLPRGAAPVLELEAKLQGRPSVQVIRVAVPEVEPETCVPLLLIPEPHAHIF